MESLHVDGRFSPSIVRLRKYEIMKMNWNLAALGIAMALFVSCGEKEKSNDIVTRKVAEIKNKTTQKVGDYSQSRVVDWRGAAFTIAVERKADATLPIVDDGAGDKYYDNRVVVCITDKSGVEVMNRVFTKADFKQYVDEGYYKNSALLGVVFDRAEEDCLYFAASVGSPDKMSDEYVPLIVKVAHGSYQVSISKDTLLDTDNAKGSDMELQQSEDEGV